MSCNTGVAHGSLGLRYKSVSYSCITSWRLNNSYSTADEQPPCI